MSFPTPAPVFCKKHTCQVKCDGLCRTPFDSNRQCFLVICAAYMRRGATGFFRPGGRLRLRCMLHVRLVVKVWCWWNDWMDMLCWLMVVVILVVFFFSAWPAARWTTASLRGRPRMAGNGHRGRRPRPTILSPPRPPPKGWGRTKEVFKAFANRGVAPKWTAYRKAQVIKTYNVPGWDFTCLAEFVKFQYRNPGATTLLVRSGAGRVRQPCGKIHCQYATQGRSRAAWPWLAGVDPQDQGCAARRSREGLWAESAAPGGMGIRQVA